MTTLTKYGMPELREETYHDYSNELRAFKTLDQIQDHFLERFSEIKKKDSLYAKFITDTSGMYPEKVKTFAWAGLITGYELLSKEGELPILNEEKFKKRWDGTMNRAVVMMNIGMNMDAVKWDNPIYWGFIMQSGGCVPEDQRMNILSDLSSGYMFLVDNSFKPSQK